jgi:site-specific DNA recombinase
MHGCCTAKSMSHLKLTAAFEEYISNIEDFTQENIDVMPKEEIKPNNNAEKEAITAELIQIEAKAAEITQLFVTNTIDFNAYQSMVKFNNQRRGELETRLAIIKSSEEPREPIYTDYEIVSNLKENWHTLENAQRQQFIQKFINRITVHSKAPKGEKYGEVIINDLVFNEF